MIESTLIEMLSNDAQFTGYVSTFGGVPAIFAGAAPEKAELPYLVIDVDRHPVSDGVLERMQVEFDFLDRGPSRKNTNAAMFRLDTIFDFRRNTVSDERYSSIRFRFDNAGFIKEEDSRGIRYNVRYSVRACRKTWIDNLPQPQ